MVLKRVLAIMLTGMLATMTIGMSPVNAQSLQGVPPDAGQDNPEAAKVRLDVSKLGVGKKAQAEFMLRDKSKLKGYIGEANDDSFSVVDSRNGFNKRIAYADVQKVNKAGSGFSTRSWIILGAAIAGAVATWIIVKPALCDGGAQTRGPC